MRGMWALFLTVSGLVSMAWAQEGSLSTGVSPTNNSKWGQSYFSFTGTDMQAVNDGAPSVNIYNYLSLNYKKNSSERYSLRPAFSYKTAGFSGNGDRQDSEVYLNDAYVNYSNYDLALLPGEWALSGQFRFYFPTSEGAAEKKQIGELYTELISEKLLGQGWAISYTTKTSYFLQSQKAYRYEKVYPDGGKKIEARANHYGEMDHYFTLKKFLNSTFTPAVDLGLLHEWNYTSEQVRGGSASRNQLKIAPNTEIHLNRSAWFILGIENATDLNDTRLTSQWEDRDGRSIKLFHPENTQYYLMTFIML
ncbi:MAG: hypothetical protein ACAH59_00935 [Pseudobdellovibrionaceae bacterium]